MSEENKELKRVTITLSDRHFNYLDDQMEKTNMTRTSLIQLAIETWINQRESIDVLGQLMAEVDRQRAEDEKIEMQGFVGCQGVSLNRARASL